MTKPLALIFYERLLPGSQLVNRLHDLEYRVETLTEAALLPKAAQEKRPLVMILDLVSKGVNICDLIRELKVQPSTSHIPIIGFADQNQKKLHDQVIRLFKNRTIVWWFLNTRYSITFRSPVSSR